VAYRTLRALRGDVTYQVTFKQGASAEVKTAVIKASACLRAGRPPRRSTICARVSPQNTLGDVPHCA